MIKYLLSNIYSEKYTNLWSFRRPNRLIHRMKKFKTKSIFLTWSLYTGLNFYKTLTGGGGAWRLKEGIN